METTKLDTGINTNYSLLQSKLNSLNSTANSKAVRNFSDEEKSQLAETARGFESIFVNMMYKGMKSAMLDTVNDNSEENMTFGADTLSGYTDMAFADQIAGNNGGIGIAKMIYNQITGEQLTAEKSINLAAASGKSITNSINIEQNKQEESKQSTISLNFNIKGNNNEKASNGNLIERVNKRISGYETTIQSAAERFDLPVSLIKAVITAESAGNPSAKSTVGAKGLMQLMDATAKDLGVTNSYDPKQNIIGGAKYLRQMLNTFDGNLDKAIAAYNAGPGNVKKYGGIPPFSETQSYVKKVKSHLKAFEINV